jgi:enoyl-CoA hydratase/carnithine racemase
MTEFIKLEIKDLICILTLNRPENLNAWNQQMRMELKESITDVVENDEIRALIITGSGRAFSAGEDVRGMKNLAEVSTLSFRRVVREIHNVFDEIESMEIPVIAAINGVAAGGGLELALSCDFRFAADVAKLGLPETNVGLIPGSGGCSRLVNTVGLSFAKRMVMTGEMIPASKALKMGLIDEVFPSENLISETISFAKVLSTKAPQSIGVAKVVLNNCTKVDLNTGRNFERLGQSILKKTSDHLEGAASFIQKRKPNFTGK